MRPLDRRWLIVLFVIFFGLTFIAFPRFGRLILRTIAPAPTPTLRPTLSPLPPLNMSILAEMHNGQSLMLREFIQSGRCRHLYLDMGSNIGVQIRKLYQPEGYPKAAVLPIFDSFFGAMRNSVCAVGFEANPHHTKRLTALQESFRSAGFPCVIFTNSAVSRQSGTVDFYLDTSNNHEQLGASVLPWLQNGAKVTAISLHMNTFINALIQDWRKSPAYSKDSKVVAKMDIEGAEFDVLPDMLHGQSLCAFDMMFVEFHHWFAPLAPKDFNDKSLNFLLSKMENCKASLSVLDDESYVDDNGTPLPKPLQSKVAVLRRM